MIELFAGYQCDVDVYDPKVNADHVPSNLKGAFVKRFMLELMIQSCWQWRMMNLL